MTGPLPWAALAYTALVAYGSLLLFAFTPHGLSDAYAAFSAISWRSLDASDRADRIANLLLYVPLGFLLCGAAKRSSRRPRGRCPRWLR